MTSRFKSHIDPIDHTSYMKRHLRPLTPFDKDFHLLPHQVTAITRLLKSSNIIYADKPGLGKTIGAAVHAKMLSEYAIEAMVRDVVPSRSPSTFYQQTFAKKTNACIDMEHTNLRLLFICDAPMVQHWYHFFTVISPQFANKHVYKRPRNFTKIGTIGFPPRQSDTVIITSFAAIEYACRDNIKDESKELPAILKIHWDKVYIDEAHRLANDLTSTHKAVLKLKSKGYVLITGTPVINTIRNLRAFATIFENSTSMEEKSKRGKAFWRGRRVDDPEVKLWCEEFMFSRNNDEAYQLAVAAKDVIAIDMLAERKRIVVEEDLGDFNSLQKSLMTQYYKHFHIMKACDDKKKSRKTNSVICMATYLQRINISPYLVANLNSNHDFAQNKLAIKNDTINPIWSMIDPTTLYETSAMLQYIVRILLRAKYEKKKVIVFNSSVQTLKMFQHILTSPIKLYEEWTTVVTPQQHVVVLQGSEYTETSERRAITRTIQAKSIFNAQTMSATDNPVVLVSTKYGSCGLDLKAACIAILTDSSFNPMIDIQALLRIDRIGQKSLVEFHIPGYLFSPWSCHRWILSVCNPKLHQAGIVTPHI